MPRPYYIAPDAENEPTLWRHGPEDREPVALCRRLDTGDEAWGLVEDGAWLRSLWLRGSYVRPDA